MARVLRMPGVAANATEAVLSEWLVEEAADFAAADALATVETEKAAVEVEAEDAGRVLKALVPAGAQVEVGDPIAVLGDPGEQVDDLDALLASLGVATVSDPVVPTRRDVPTDPPNGSAPPLVEEIEMPASPGPRPGEVANGRVFASPLARKIAKDAGLAIDQINGSGPRGRILRRDVDAAIATRRTEAPARATPAPATPVERPSPESATATYQEIPHSRMRRAIARRLTESQQQAPHFYLRATVRAEALLALRAEINQAEDGVRISLNDLVVKAVAAAHSRVPEMNVTWGPDAVRQFTAADVAVAVSTEGGLLTPVVRDVGAMAASAVAEAVRDLAARARDGKLHQAELEGGSICVTNLGMFGVEEFSAIINPPHAAILAVGAVRDEPVVEAGEVVAGRVVSLTLAVDHRPVDGVLAARWLQALTELLAHPARVLA